MGPSRKTKRPGSTAFFAMLEDTPSSAPKKRLVPSFLIIGAQRSGTTSLYWNLCEHPSILPASRKEVHFFDDRFAAGNAWYDAHFPFSESAGQITGEASPAYLLHPLAAARAASLLPNAKLIVILRNPIDRAFSHYHHELRRKNEHLSLSEALDCEEERIAGEREKLLTGTLQRSSPFLQFSYCLRGHYAEHLETWLKHYPRKQMHVIISESFFSNRYETLQTTARYLEIPAFPNPHNLALAHYNIGSGTTPDHDVRKRLSDYFKPHNARLEDLLGLRLPWD